MSISPEKLRFWVDNGYNVIFEGQHGVGKTQLITATFNEKFGEQGIDWLYFSAPTMDPWVDFVGVPKEVVDESGNAHLALVRPKAFAMNTVQGIFFDEYNRSPPKIRNAVMELMQFGSINGHKFPNLKVIWAAINPPDEDDDGLGYNVEKIDPAQLDRFHVHKSLPYTVSKSYFIGKYGESAGLAACDWWNTLTAKAQAEVSPRRLDYILDCWSKNGDIRDMIPAGIPVSQLKSQLNNGSFTLRLQKILKGDLSKDDIIKELKDEGFFSIIEDKIKREQKVFKSLFPYLEDEKMIKIISSLKPAEITSRLKTLGASSKEDIERISKVLNAALSTNEKWLTATKRKAVKLWILENYNRGNPDTLPNNKGNTPKNSPTPTVAENILKDFSEMHSNASYFAQTTIHREECIKFLIDNLVENSDEIERNIKDGNISKKTINSFLNVLDDIMSRSTEPKRGQYAKTFNYQTAKNAKKRLHEIFLYMNTYFPTDIKKNYSDKLEDFLRKTFKTDVVLTKKGLIIAA